MIIYNTYNLIVILYELKRTFLMFACANAETAMGVSLDDDNAGKSYKDAIYKIGDIIIYRYNRLNIIIR
jgi:hypothetical protein